MGRSIRLQIGQRVFPNKKETIKYIQGIQTKYKNGERIDSSDEPFLRDLLNLHPRALEKIGEGISHFSIDPNDFWKGKTRHFKVHRVDGTATDFSFLKCVNGINSDGEALHAMRTAVVDQILEFRDKQFQAGTVKCPFTREVLAPNTAHVDHVAPDTFEALVFRWLSQEGLAISTISITPSQDNQVAREMIDHRQRSSWQHFHDMNAHLRLTSKLGNLSHAKKKRLSPPSG